jgi:phosphate-selective porin
VKASGTLTEDVDYEVMFDPSIATSTTNPVILQDAWANWKLGGGVSLKIGQYKNLQSYEGLTSSTEILFAERSQLGRVFGDKRDRGAALSFAFGSPRDFGGKFTVAAFNGMGDAASGKAADNNAQKDMVARLDLNMGIHHKFGAYTLQGVTDVTDKSGVAIAPATPGSGWPTQASVYDNKDATSNLGAYYAYQDSTWTFTSEVMTGLLGRRAATLAASAPAVKREHLDQKFMGYYVTGGYTTGNHTFLLRYDFFNWNSGDQWHAAYNPYTQSAPGVALLAQGSPVDYTPKFTEITLGYTYAFLPEKVKAANIKVNYVMRSKNFLVPRAGQTGEQGGDTLVVAFLVAF